MRLAEIVATSRRIGAVSGRLEKIALLADALRRCEPEWVETAVALLAGRLRRGRIGVGYATLKAARAVPAAGEPALTLADLDQVLERFMAVKGKGSAGERARVLHELFARATEDKQDFLFRLLLGDRPPGPRHQAQGLRRHLERGRS